jgi:tartrate dehydratase beta subunit/fumarate hydratase class I family protein
MKTYQLALACAIVIASPSLVAAEEWRMDPTPDHIYYYGPVAHPAAPTSATQRKVSRHVAQHQTQRVQEVPIDRTADHVLYYGPVAH